MQIEQSLLSTLGHLHGIPEKFPTATAHLGSCPALLWDLDDIGEEGNSQHYNLPDHISIGHQTLNTQKVGFTTLVILMNVLHLVILEQKLSTLN